VKGLISDEWSAYAECRKRTAAQQRMRKFVHCYRSVITVQGIPALLRRTERGAFLKAIGHRQPKGILGINPRNPTRGVGNPKRNNWYLNT